MGKKACYPILIEGLRRLEYRGYASAGLAVVSGSGLMVVKEKGKISHLARRIQAAPPEGSIGIAHTRWATHGEPSARNAHPHTGCRGHFAVVHNGIIENCEALRQQLTRRGHVFTSGTDTEVLAHLIEECFTGSLEEAVAMALKIVEGTYGVAVVSDFDANKIVGARNGSPLVVGIGRDEFFVASDVSAILEHTNQVIYLEDEEMVILTGDGHRTQTLDEVSVTKRIEQVTFDLSQIERGGFDHFS